MKRLKKISKQEQINSINQTLQYNSDALDYIQNEISRYEDMLLYKEDWKEGEETLNILKYIEFSLKYLDDSYNKSLILLGG